MALNTIQRLTNAAIGEKEVLREEPEGVSYLGTPVLSRLVLGKNEEGGADSYENLKGETIEITPVTIDTAIIQVSQTKNIVKTTIEGRDGTVKEYINEGDFDVMINIELNSGNINNISAYPEEQVRNLMTILRSTREVSVESRFLNDFFEITDIVITGYDIPQQEGVSNIIPVRIKAVSELNELKRIRLEE